MSSSRHPVALRLERRVGGATRLLATVMLLPLVDGVFPALVLGGALGQTTTVGPFVVPTGVLQVGLLVFGGSATVAVVLVDMEGTSAEKARKVLLVGLPLVGVAAVEAAFAPTITGLLATGVFERFAAFVVLAIAAKTASSRIGDFFPRPSVVVGLGLLASIRPSAAAVSVQVAPGLVVVGAAAGAVGVAFALSVALLDGHLRRLLDVDRFRFGSAVALGTLALSLFGVVPDGAALPVFVLAGLLAVDPGGDDAIGDRPVANETEPTAERVQSPATEAEPAPDEPVSPAVASAADESAEDAERISPYGYLRGDATEERAPWL